MTTATTPSPAEEHFRNEAHGEGHEEHPSDLKYVKIAIFLAVVTALEVATYFFELETGQLLLILFPMMAIKFGTVILYFMHLKFDNPLFSWLFYAGLLLAVSVYVAALATFEFFLPT